MSKMTESELKAILSAEIADSIGHIGGELSEQRRKALDYYLGQPFGNEIEGRSKVVSTDVSDTIEWILPSLLRIFTAGDDVVRYEPTGPEDEEVARQATEYANWIFNRDNSGFLFLYTIMKDSLLQKNGIGKVWWEETEEERREVYRQKTPEEAQMLLADPDVELLELREYQAERIGIDATGAVVAMPVSYHDVTVKRRSRNGRVRVMPVPPEEFLISRRARGIEEAAFVGHRVRRTVSELLALGYDRKIVEALPDALEDEPTGEERARFDFDDTGEPGGGHGLNRAMREVWITECYIRADWDGDGIAERRKITVGGSGEEILDNEAWDGPLPFISLTPIIMPHRFFGLSVADLVMDLQLIKSTILRQILDNLYLSNNGRHVISDQVNLDDMLTVRPGGIVRLKSGAMPGQGHVLPLDTPLVAAQAFPMLEYLDGVREGRTGVTRYNQGLHAETLNKTAAGINQIMTAAQQRVELIARVFAETGIKDLFRKILELVGKHQSAPRIIRLRNRWVPMDPRSWNTQMDLSINVGLGTGNRDQMLTHLQNLLGIQVQAIKLQGGVAGPIVTLDNIYNTLAKLVENAGLKSVDAYFTAPGAMPPAPQQPPQAESGTLPMDPNVMALQQKTQVDAARLAFDQRRAAADMEFDRAKLAAQMAMKRDELALRAQRAGLG